MRKLALAALYAAASACAAQASTTITFTGVTDADFGAYTRTVTNSTGVYAYDRGVDTFTATLTFDLSGFTNTTDDNIGYYGTTFTNVSISNSGITPLVLTSGVADDGITVDPDPDTGSVTLNYGRTQIGAGDAYTYTSLSFYSNGPVPLTMIDGVLAPDLSQIDLDANPFTFYFEDHDGTNSDYVSHTLTGQITSLSVSTTSDVPEPASWAMMVGGFGLAGAAMRRRRVAFAL